MPFTMTLSVCIPVYNSDLTKLVYSLSEEIQQCQLDAEVVVIDDCSSLDFQKTNAKLDSLCTYVQLQENIGRSKIRNRFLKHAKGNYLLFIDGDSQLISNRYLSSYIGELQKAKVLCGGNAYATERPKRTKLLRWKVSKNRENKHGFQSNNFCIEKTLFKEIQFNESLEGYGHEDTLFGFRLQQKRIAIQRFDNPILNAILDNNSAFLAKTKHGVQNLVHVHHLLHADAAFAEQIPLLCTYFTLKKRRLRSVVRVFLQLIHPINTFFLKKGYFTLCMFDLYKLFCLLRSNLRPLVTKTPVS